MFRMGTHETIGAIASIAAARFFSVMFLSGLPVVAKDGGTVRRTQDVIYGRKFGMALTLDVFQPAQANRFALLFLVNGGWQSSKATPMMVTIRPGDYQPFLDRGYTVFAVVTSSQPKFTIPKLPRTCVAPFVSYGQTRRATACVPIASASWDQAPAAT